VLYLAAPSCYWHPSSYSVRTLDYEDSFSTSQCVLLQRNEDCNTMPKDPDHYFRSQSSASHTESLFFCDVLACSKLFIV
jgi:hypothetical protein